MNLENQSSVTFQLNRKHRAEVPTIKSLRAELQKNPTFKGTLKNFRKRVASWLKFNANVARKRTSPKVSFNGRSEVIVGNQKAEVLKKLKKLVPELLLPTATEVRDEDWRAKKKKKTHKRKGGRIFELKKFPLNSELRKIWDENRAPLQEYLHEIEKLIQDSEEAPLGKSKLGKKSASNKKKQKKSNPSVSEKQVQVEEEEQLVAEQERKHTEPTEAMRENQTELKEAIAEQEKLRLKLEAFNKESKRMTSAQKEENAGREKALKKKSSEIAKKIEMLLSKQKDLQSKHQAPEPQREVQKEKYLKKEKQNGPKKKRKKKAPLSASPQSSASASSASADGKRDTESLFTVCMETPEIIETIKQLSVHLGDLFIAALKENMGPLLQQGEEEMLLRREGVENEVQAEKAELLSSARKEAERILETAKEEAALWEKKAREAEKRVAGAKKKIAAIRKALSL